VPLGYDRAVFPRSIKSWFLIALGMVIIVCVALWVLSMLSARPDLARVKVAGSNLTLVIYQDEEDRHRYDVLASRKKVARGVKLGSRGALAVEPQVAVLGDHVTITFRTTENEAAFVEFDLAACRIVSHSNEHSPLPPISGCRRK
jgi:hypothetical protein